MEEKTQNGWDETLAVISMQIEALQYAVTTLEEKQGSKFLSRKQLAAELECSERYIQDSLEFKSIEHKIGGRIFYIRDEVDMIIRQSPSNRGDSV